MNDDLGYCTACKRACYLKEDGLLEEHHSYLVLASRHSRCPGSHQEPGDPDPEDLDE